MMFSDPSTSDSSGNRNDPSLALCQALLARNDIYYIAFNKLGVIVSSNYPVETLTLNHIDDLVFLVGPANVETIKSALVEDTPSNTIAFTIANLTFELVPIGLSNGELLWCLQIQAKADIEAPAKPGGVERDYQIIMALESSLSALSQASGNQLPEHMLQELKAKHLPEVEARLAQIQDPVLKMCLEIIRSSMENLLNDTAGISHQLLDVLTPSELQVAEFIRSGMSSQEIASALNVARKTVENHRNSVRTKLGITNRGVNLRNYLLSLEKK